MGVGDTGEEEYLIEPFTPPAGMINSVNQYFLTFYFINYQKRKGM